MAMLRCRECGTEINSETRQTRCKSCGTLFPFECVVCRKSLRPPFSIYPEERFLTSDNRPLCEDHYQRQCPDCSKWFRADENPGYFRCPSCTEQRSAAPSTTSSASAAGGNVLTATAPAATASSSHSAQSAASDSAPAQPKRAGCALSILAGAALTAGMGSSLFELGRHLLDG